jgi:Tetratricopeptide repeat
VRLADPPSLLAGREDLLADLHTRLTGSDGPRPRTVALCGFGGAGKTSVALAYAHSHLAEVRVAWQLAAENPTVLADGFGQLAAQLGARDVVDTRDPVASVHGLLAAFPDEWLLIFDNAPDRASVQAFLPPAGSGRVMITSQNPNWPYGQAMRVPLLDAEVATDFLISRTGDPDRQSAVDLASGLDGLPLALEQAAAYIQATQGTLAGYLDMFQQRRAEMLARGEPTGYDKTVASTWALAFGRLCRSAPGASGLLRLLACCAPEAIPLRLLLQPRPGLAGRFGGEVAVLARLLEDPLAASDAVAALRRYSLVTRAADGSVLVHRLVQNVMLCRMPADLAVQWRQAAAALIEAAIPGDNELPGTWRACAELLPHAQVALADDSDGMARIATYLGFSGNFMAARDLHRRVLDTRERILGEEDLGTLTARYQLAFWTGAAGYRAEARDLFAGLLPVQEHVLGPEHSDALATRHQLARWTGHLGDPAAARDQFAALLPVEERVLGFLHPRTLRVRYELGRWTGKAGSAAAARDLLAELLPTQKHVLGPEHPETLTTCSSLATWIGEEGDPAAARDLLAGLLLVQERVLGPDHADTLANQHELARWTQVAART